MKDNQGPTLRPPAHVMRLSQMGAMFPTRISFLRIMLRQLARDRSQVQRLHWSVCADGYGAALYSIDLGGHTYSLFAISQALDPSQRTDRVIANAWDAAFVLYDGIPDQAEITRLAANAPKQEAGRFGPRDLCLSRANKSVRLFSAAVDAMRNGGALDWGAFMATGYLMRTTAVYGNGKFGLADRSTYANRPDMHAPFMAEMLTVWLIRHFTFDLVEHVGQGTLSMDLKRALGVGNSTGLGMAPFLVSHPDLLHAWMETRETALARALSAPVGPSEQSALHHQARQAMQHLIEWNVPDPEHQARIVQLRRDWARWVQRLNGDAAVTAQDIKALIDTAPTADFEELAIAWVIEVLGNDMDDLTPNLTRPGTDGIDATMTCQMFKQQLDEACTFAMRPDYDSPDDTAHFWYVSQSKLEPRFGRRHEEPGADQESPLDVARRMAALATDLETATGPLWQFLAAHPHHREAAERVQRMLAQPYSEIRDNLICDTTQPINMLRCKLSFFGATKFDPKSRLWTRIALGQGAPLASDIVDGTMVDQTWLSSFAP